MASPNNNLNAQQKLGRNYSLALGLSNQPLTFVGPTLPSVTPLVLVVQPPFTVEFDIVRKCWGTSANIASVRVYNLSVANRNSLRKDVTDTTIYRSIQLAAGYGSNLPTVFSGNVTQAWSYREGVNFITQLESYDGGFAFSNAITAESFAADTPLSSILATLMNSLPYVATGTIGDYTRNLVRGNSYSGSTIDILNDLSGQGFFIDNGKAHCLGTNECLTAPIAVINSSSGLLSTPIREATILRFDMIFEPRLVLGQIVQLQSSTDQNFNGFWKVVGLKHRGMISQSVCGDAITTVELFLGTGTLETVGPS